MPGPNSLLGGRSPREFLRDFWQKKPLLIRGALPEFESPISPEELAGLALEDDAESRLIMETGGDYPWQLRYGPFDEEDFLSLPEANWTLLVQEVDRWVPDVAGLLDHFRFVPSWRIDDIMVSYAPDGGNVGAHIDNYDVFLLQGAGRREWRINTTPLHEENLVPDVDVSMLADFEPDEVWTLEPGDMLYLPPRIAHHGIAVGDCMTYSIGFRAPSHEEMLTAFLSRGLEEVDSLARYSDPDLEPQQHPGLISQEALERVRGIVQEVVSDENIARWFGALVTESSRSEVLFPSEENWTEQELIEAMESGASLERVAPNRLAYVEAEAGGAFLYAHGEEYPLAPALAFAAPLLTGMESLDRRTVEAHLHDAAFVALLTRLVNDGHLVVSDM